MFPYISTSNGQLKFDMTHFVPKLEGMAEGAASGITGSSEPTLPDGFSSDSFTGSATDYDWREYLEGLFSSVGAENEVNRLYNSAEAKANRDFQASEAAAQREWYEEMSSSAYQRAVSDMRKAGINPILAYAQGGAASSPTGIASGSASSYQTGGGDTFSSILQSIAALVSSITSSAGKLAKPISIKGFS